MKENLIYTVVGYLFFAVMFLPLLLLKGVFWVGLAVLFTIAASIFLGQIIKVIVKYFK